jgi:hypothetical protein
MKSMLYMLLPALVGAAALAGDTIKLRDGRTIDGTFMGGDTRQVRLMTSDGRLENFAISDVESISFPGPAPAATITPAAPPAPVTPARSQTAAVPSRPAAAAASAGRVVVPAGTVVTVRLIDSIDSDVAGAGERFRASLDTPLQVGEKTIAPRGSDVSVQLVRVEQSGKLSGRDEVAMDLFDITVNGKKYPVATSYAEVQSDSRTGQTAKVVGGTAALGAVIGAIAGGGRGAAIGAASGAGAGTAVQVLTRGERVKIPSESRLDFTLKQPLVIE